MGRITQKELKFSKALRKAGYEITMKRWPGGKYYEVFSPPQEEGQPGKKVWEIIKPTEGVLILLGEDEKIGNYHGRRKDGSNMPISS